MSEKRLLTVAATDPATLAAWLGARLPCDDATASVLVSRGCVFSGGRRLTQGDAPLRCGDRLTVYWDGKATDAVPAPSEAPNASATPADAVAQLTVFADEAVWVINKPAGLPSQPGRRGGPSLSALLGPTAHLLHRLDADASGLLVVARTPLSAAELQTAMARGRIRREYLAVVAGRPQPAQGEIRLRIGPAGGGPTSPHYQTYPEQSSLGQPAHTQYRVLTTQTTGAHQHSLIWLRLFSGRTHQLRVHLLALGHPILGDALYGAAPQSPSARLYLHAFRLAFPPPQKPNQKHLRFTALPTDFPLAAPAEALESAVFPT